MIQEWCIALVLVGSLRNLKLLHFPEPVSSCPCHLPIQDAKKIYIDEVLCFILD